VHPDNGNFQKWVGTIRGPDNTPYEGGIFEVEFTFSPDYPFKPPQIWFDTPIYHMNVGRGGRAWLNIVDYGIWSPHMKISDVLWEILSMLKNQIPSYADRLELVEEYSSDKARYEEKAREIVRKYAQ
jgi:ubiquitin-conjugating enzyme E2 D/E